jgi:hypothetical protein
MQSSTLQFTDGKRGSEKGDRLSCLLALHLSNPAETRSGVNGVSRRRIAVASKIALAITAAIGAPDGSPPHKSGHLGPVD